MSNEIVTSDSRGKALSFNNNMAQMMEFASMMAKADLVPDHLKNKPGDCLLVISQAQQWGMNAFSVAQCTSVVHGRLMFEGKLVHAALESMGCIKPSTHKFEYKGSGSSREIKLSVEDRSGNIREVSGKFSDWRVIGKKRDGSTFKNAWDTMPDQMLLYRAWREMGRTHFPAAMLGVYTEDDKPLPEKEADIVSVDAVDPLAPIVEKQSEPLAPKERVEAAMKHDLFAKLPPEIQDEFNFEITVERLNQVGLMIKSLSSND